MTTPADDGLKTLLVIVLGALAIGLVEVLARRLSRFVLRLRYLNMEIKRTQGWERRQWKQKKRRMLLSLIPFYSLFSRERD